MTISSSAAKIEDKEERLPTAHCDPDGPSSKTHNELGCKEKQDETEEEEDQDEEDEDEVSSHARSGAGPIMISSVSDTITAPRIDAVDLTLPPNPKIKQTSDVPLAPFLPQILSAPMPNFERSYRNTILRPLTTTNVNNDPSSDDAMESAASNLRSLLRCIYTHALPSTATANSSICGEFMDASAEEASRHRLIPNTMRCILMLRSEDSSTISSSSRRNNTIVLSTRGEAIYFSLLLDFVEVTARLINIPNQYHLNQNMLDYLGREWLDVCCKALGDLHYWEYTEEDWRGVNVLIGARARSGSILPW